MQPQTLRSWPDGQGLKKVPEVAKYLGVHENTIYNWLAAGELECTRLPHNKIAFTFDQVILFIHLRRSLNQVDWDASTLN